MLLGLEISVPSEGPGAPRVSGPVIEGGIVSSALDRSSVLQYKYRVSEKDREQGPVGRVSNTAPVGGRVSSALDKVSEQQCEYTGLECAVPDLVAGVSGTVLVGERVSSALDRNSVQYRVL